MTKSTDNAPDVAQEALLGNKDAHQQSAVQLDQSAYSRGAQRATKTTSESKYSATDLASAARKRFNVPPEVVLAAMKFTKKDTATLAEAKQLIEDFKKRKVKK